MDNSDRDNEIYQMRNVSKVSIRDISKIFQLSIPRVREIIHSIDWKEERRIKRQDDLLFQIYDSGKISTAVYHAIMRGGYGEKFDFNWLIENLQSNQLKPNQIRNLGKVGIAQLKAAICS